MTNAHLASRVFYFRVGSPLHAPPFPTLEFVPEALTGAHGVLSLSPRALIADTAAVSRLPGVSWASAAFVPQPPGEPQRPTAQARLMGPTVAQVCPDMSRISGVP